MLPHLARTNFMETEIREINPSGESTRRARMKMSYQALSRILRGNFFPIEHCTAPEDLLITGIESDKDAYYCWVEYHSNSLPEVDVSQPLPETDPWVYVPADVWKKVLELSESIDEIITEAEGADDEPFVSCADLSASLKEIIDGRKIDK